MLSERDKRVLAEMERRFSQDDPALDRVLRAAPGRSRRLSEIRLLVVGLLVLVASVVPGAGPVTFVLGLVLTLYAFVRLLPGKDVSASGTLSRLRWQDPSR